MVVTVPPGRAFSITAQRWPKNDASSVALSPAGPDPMAIKSYVSLIARTHCIWSSASEKARFSLSAFLISSAVAYGYSPYSRKLGH